MLDPKLSDNWWENAQSHCKTMEMCQGLKADQQTGAEIWEILKMKKLQKCYVYWYSLRPCGKNFYKYSSLLNSFGSSP